MHELDDIVLKVDMPTHPKVLAVGAVGAWLHVCGICYAAKYKTKGFIPGTSIRALAISIPAGDLDAAVSSLLEHGLWVADPGGYRVHDFEDYQSLAARYKSSAAVRNTAIESVRAAIVRRGGKAKVRLDIQDKIRHHTRTRVRRPVRDEIEIKERVVNNNVSREQQHLDVDDDSLHKQQTTKERTTSHARASTHAHAHAHAYTSARGEPLLSRFEFVMGVEATERFIARYQKLDRNLDALWFTKMMSQCGKAHPDMERQDIVDAIDKAIGQTRVGTVKSSVTAYAATVLRDRFENQWQLAIRRKEQDEKRRRSNAANDHSPESRSTNTGGHRMDLATRERLLREQISGEPS